MSSFTPGPWEMGPDEFGNWVIYREKNDQEIATIYPDDYRNKKMWVSDDEAWANRMDADARLIAAAPELANILKEIVDAIEIVNDFNSGLLGGPLRVQPKLIDRAKALLHRIDGEEAPE